jgi:methyl halide transferase
MSLMLDSEYWQQRYKNSETGWDIGEVSQPLKEYFDQLTDKSIFILIPGAGNSYEAEYLLQNGFKNIFVCDYASEPLSNLKLRVPHFNTNQLIQSDFFDLPYRNFFDLIVEQTFFCAIDPSLRRKYFEKCHDLLKSGGRLAGLLFNDTLNYDHPPFGGDQEEYVHYFNDLFERKVYEKCYNSIKPRQGRELFINLIKK